MYLRFSELIFLKGTKFFHHITGNLGKFLTLFKLEYYKNCLTFRKIASPVSMFESLFKHIYQFEFVDVYSWWYIHLYAQGHYIHNLYIFVCIPEGFISPYFKMSKKNNFVIFSWIFEGEFHSLAHKSTVTNYLFHQQYFLLLFYNYTIDWSRLSVHFTKKYTMVFNKIILPGVKVMSENYNMVPGMHINILIRMIRH